MTKPLKELTVKDFQDLIFREYIAKGFFEKWEHVTPRVFGFIAEAGLITEEIGELEHVLRNEGITDKAALADCICDIIIRAANLGTRAGIKDLAVQLLAVIMNNEKRPYLHGKKVI